jgi:ribose-phosphate pyrophosphokinase
VTNTLPIDDDKRFDKLTILSVAPMIAQAIQAVFDDSSVSGLFDGTTA